MWRVLRPTAELRPSTCPPRQPGSTSAAITCTTSPVRPPSSTSARFRFDEAHTLLNRQVHKGDHIQIVKVGDDQNVYGIDFIELEERCLRFSVRLTLSVSPTTRVRSPATAWMILMRLSGR